MGIQGNAVTLRNIAENITTLDHTSKHT